MSDLRTPRHRSATFAMITAALVAIGSLLVIGGASAQTTQCPAGSRGGAGGDAGRSVAGNGGLGFTVGGFGTGSAGAANANGGTPGDARGGEGGRGGNGILPVCNQNTNGDIEPGEAPEAPEAPAAAPAAPAAPVAATQQQEQQQYGTGGGLARTGATTGVELGLAGLALALGGMFLFFGQPAKQAMLRLVGAAPAQAPTEEQDWSVLGWSPPFRKDR